MMSEPTLQERYGHLRDNAYAFVEGMEAIIQSLESKGEEDLATKLRVWCLMPWQAALRNNARGELWWTCEVCGEPIKSDAYQIATDDGCQFHQSCVTDAR
jgi:hypothetical protein